MNFMLEFLSGSLPGSYGPLARLAISHTDAAALPN
jgi:hypothetical protein